MEVIIVIIIFFAIIGFIINAVNSAKYKLEKTKNFFAGGSGKCMDCKNCIRDEERKFSSTGYYCRFDRCDHITEDTHMSGCHEKPTFTEEDLNEIKKLGIHTPEGLEYIRQNLVGKKMTFDEANDFLTKLPYEHPEYIDQEAKKKLEEMNS